MAKILIIDDQPTNRRFLKAVLHSGTYGVMEASDGSEGLVKSREERPDLIIADILMPTMDGFEFVRRLRTDHSLADTRVIFCTATYLEDETRQLAQACGVSHVILKPASPQNILDTVEAALALTRPAPAYNLTEEFDREHLRIMSNKLAQKIEELEEMNLRLTQEVTERKRAELALRDSQEQLERLNRLHEVASNVNSAFMRIRDRRELLQEAAMIAVQHGKFSAVAIDLANATGGLMPIASAMADKGPIARADSTGNGSAVHGIAEAAFARGEAVVCNDLQREEEMESWKQQALTRGYRSAAALPLSAGDRRLGAIELYAAKAESFNDAEVELLKDLASDLAFALQSIDNEEKIARLAYYNDLTNLPNRTLFCDRANQLVRGARADRNKGGIVVLDVERFSTISDTFGRRAGDSLLRQLAECLKAALKNNDSLANVSRSSFAACLPGIQDETEVAHFLEQMIAAADSANFAIEGDRIKISLKGGACIYPADGEDGETLLRNAETALQRAMGSATDHYLFFASETSARLTQKHTLENRLHQAFQNDEFVLHYQPKIDLRTNRITGLEALLRWNHPQQGLVYPAAFIRTLEESGLILYAGRWALDKATADYRRWARGNGHPPRVSVNVSALQLKQKDFFVSVADAADKCRNGSTALDLELTESLIMDNIEQAVPQLEKFKDIGVDIAIDDFGTGYSSLSYIAKLPVNALKIDRSFIIDLDKNPDSMSIVSAIISLAHSLNMKVIAEGVESEQQLQLLKLLKCDEIQGYVFSPAVAADDVERLLAT